MQNLQKFRVGNLLFRSMFFCSCRSFVLDVLLFLSLFYKEQFAPVALFKRATRAKWADRSFHFLKQKSDLLFMKEQREQIPLYKKSKKSDSLCFVQRYWFIRKSQRAIIPNPQAVELSLSRFLKPEITSICQWSLCWQSVILSCIPFLPRILLRHSLKQFINNWMKMLNK